MTEEQLRRCKAYHEAGHAVLAYKLNLYYPKRTWAGFPEVTIRGSASHELPTTYDYELSAEDWRCLELVTCAGEVADRLFFGDVMEKHESDRKELRRLEGLRRENLDLPPLIDEEDDRWITDLIDEATRHLEQPKWKRLVEAVAEKLLIHESLDFGQLVGVAMQEFGVGGLPDELCYFKGRDDERPWTVTCAESKGIACENVLITFIGWGDELDLLAKLSLSFPELSEDYGLETVAGHDSIRSFLRCCLETIECMTINPILDKGQFCGVCVHRISALAAPAGPDDQAADRGQG